MSRPSRWAAAAATGLLLTLLVPPVSAHADDIRDLQWQLAFLEMTRARQLSQGDDVSVAVVDYGINGAHPDLVDNVLEGTSVLAGHPTNGWEDVDAHGTAMAGLIAGHGHSGTSGILGIAPRAKVLPIQIGSGDEFSGPDAVGGAIDYAVEHHARVISISLGYAGGSVGLQDAIKRAEKADVVIVASVGNAPKDLTVTWPARYDGVVAVAAVDQNGDHAGFSVAGPQVTVAAPGVDVESTGLHDGYRHGSGTSEATAITAGVVALIRSKYPNLSATEVVNRLTATATDRGAPGRDNEYGYGIVNPYAALTADVPSTSAGPSIPPGQSPTGPSPGQTGQTPQRAGNGKAGLAVMVVLIGVAVAASIWIRRAAARYRSGR